MLKLHQQSFYLNDLLSILLCLFFAVCSFLNLGRLRLPPFRRAARYKPSGSSSEGSIARGLDRELVYGLFFILLIPLLLLFYRLTDTASGGVVKFLRLFYVQGLYGLFFKESIILSQLFFRGRSLDRWFARADQFLFHYQPAKRFHKDLPNRPLVTELFFFGYFSYFLLAIGSYWILYLSGKTAEAAYALTVTTASFYLLYLFYTFFPVQGPKYFFPDLNRLWYSNFNGFLITRFMKALFKNMNLAGAAFPSSHVAISLMVLIFNFQYNPPLALVFLPLTLLLFASTVYIYAHYFIDIVGGILAGVALYLLIPWLLRWIAALLTQAHVPLAGVLGLYSLK